MDRDNIGLPCGPAKLGAIPLSPSFDGVEAHSIPGEVFGLTVD
jgi:hypothetical protein